MPNGKTRKRRGRRLAGARLFFLLVLALASAQTGCRVLGYPEAPPAARELTATPTGQPLVALEDTPTPVPTDTPVPTVTWSPTVAPTNTRIPPTDTPIPPTDTLPPPTVTAAPPTSTPIPPTATPLPTNPPTVAVVEAFSEPTSTPPCATTPQWGLGDVWQNPEVKERLGCPVGPQMGVDGEEMYFQRGHMLWRPDNGLIYVLSAPYMPDGWGAVADTSSAGEALATTLIPPTPRVGEARLYLPTGRFGKVWLENPWMEERIGWAVRVPGSDSTELINTFAGAVQDFERGVLFWNRNVCFVLYTDDMSWTIY